VDGAACDFSSVFEGLLLGVEAGERGEQGWVDVEDAVGEGTDEAWRDDAHVTGEADEVDFVLMEAGEHLGVVVGTLATSGGNAERGEVHLARRGETGSVFAVGEDDGDFGTKEALLLDGFGNGEEVGTSAGEEDAETAHERVLLVELGAEELYVK
jgi:hypothetical protein